MGGSIFASELDGKRQDILIEAVPGLHNMAALIGLDHSVTGQAQRDASVFFFLRQRFSLITRPSEIAY